jgi:O-methyltransferase
LRFPTYTPEIQQAIKRAQDPHRLSTIALSLRTIEQDGIPGAIAECGVWRGDLSVFLRLNSTRKLFLFDTFSGFSRSDLRGESDDRFRNTSFEFVMSRVSDAIPRPGHFPNTAKGLENEVFAFVMLDFDLYGPILSGLEFFYPRIPRGGYLFLHDYNNPTEPGVSQAANEFFKDKPEKLIELSDCWGSALIRKI